MALNLYTRAPGASTWTLVLSQATLNATFDAAVGAALHAASLGTVATVAIVDDGQAASAPARYWIAPVAQGREP